MFIDYFRSRFINVPLRLAVGGVFCTFVQNKYVRIYGRFFRAAAAHDRA